MGPIQVVVEDGNNLVLEVTPTPDTTVILDRGIAGPPGPAGDGDVDGPASSTDNAVARFDGTTGKVIQNSNVTIDDSGNLTYSAGTANGVAYLNGSKVLTTGSALTFDGTTLGLISSGLNTQNTVSDTVDPISATTNQIRMGAAGFMAFRIGTAFDFNLDSYNSAFPINVYNVSSAGVHKWSVAGSEQMRLTSTGLGIGTSSPGSLWSGANRLVVGGGSGASGTTIYTGTGDAGTLAFADGTTGTDPYRGFVQYLHSNDSMLLGTAGSTKATLDSSGNLGIGTSSPSDRVHAYANAADVGIQVQNNTHGSFLRSDATGTQIATNSATKPIYFYVGAAERMRLDSSGNLGIGTSSPGEKLTVSSTAATFAAQFISSASFGSSVAINATATGGKQWAIQATANGDGTVGGGFFTINNQTDASVPFRLSASGNLGLGVTPSAWTTVTPAIELKNGVHFATLNTGTPLAYFGANCFYNGSNWIYKVSTNNAVRYELNSGGNGSHAWFTAPSGTAGDAISFTQALTLTSDGNLVAGNTTTSFRINATVASGADRDIFGAQIAGASNGFTVKWNHSTTTTRVNIQNLPTSSAGLAAGDLYNDSGTLKVA
jgi:hypothetical protein